MTTDKPADWKANGRALHVNVSDKLRDRINSDEFVPGGMIDSESELCRSLGVSRVTVRQSLSILEREGLVSTVPGKGRFVTKRASAGDRGTEVLKIRVLVDTTERLACNAWFLEAVDELVHAAACTRPRCQLSFEFHQFSVQDMVSGRALEKGDCQGVLIIPFSHQYMDFLAAQRAFLFPVVSFLRRINSNAFSQFYIDQEVGVVRATEYLLRYGHRRIGMVSVSPTYLWPASEEREAGYRRALDEAGVSFDPRLIVRPTVAAEDIHDVCLDMLKSDDRPTALLIGGAVLLNPVLQAIGEARLRIPEQLSVIAFDDLPEVRLHKPPLTVVKQLMGQGLRQALDQLVAEIQCPGKKPVKVGLEPELIVRGSCVCMR